MWMRKSFGRTVNPEGPGMNAAEEHGSVEPPPRDPVLHVVPEHVADRIRHLAWALQRAGVEAVGENLADHPMRLVEASRHAHGEALHAAGQRDRVLRFNEHVQVVSLDAEVRHSDAEPLLATAERFLERAEAAGSAQARTTARDSHRHVGGRSPRLLPRNVRRSGSRSFRLPPGAFAIPTP